MTIYLHARATAVVNFHISYSLDLEVFGSLAHIFSIKKHRQRWIVSLWLWHLVNQVICKDQQIMDNASMIAYPSSSGRTVISSLKSTRSPHCSGLFGVHGVSVTVTVSFFLCAAHTVSRHRQLIAISTFMLKIHSCSSWNEVCWVAFLLNLNILYILDLHVHECRANICSRVHKDLPYSVNSGNQMHELISYMKSKVYIIMTTSPPTHTCHILPLPSNMIHVQVLVGIIKPHLTSSLNLRYIISLKCIHGIYTFPVSIMDINFHANSIWLYAVCRRLQRHFQNHRPKYWLTSTWYLMQQSSVELVCCSYV